MGAQNGFRKHRNEEAGDYDTLRRLRRFAIVSSSLLARAGRRGGLAFEDASCCILIGENGRMPVAVDDPEKWLDAQTSLYDVKPLGWDDFVVRPVNRAVNKVTTKDIATENSAPSHSSVTAGFCVSLSKPLKSLVIIFCLKMRTLEGSYINKLSSVTWRRSTTSFPLTGQAARRW